MKVKIFEGHNRSFADGNGSEVKTKVLYSPSPQPAMLEYGTNTQEGTPYFMQEVTVYATAPGIYMVAEIGSGDCYSSFGELVQVNLEGRIVHNEPLSEHCYGILQEG